MGFSSKLKKLFQSSHEAKLQKQSLQQPKEGTILPVKRGNFLYGHIGFFNGRWVAVEEDGSPSKTLRLPGQEDGDKGMKKEQEGSQQNEDEDDDNEDDVETVRENPVATSHTRRSSVSRPHVWWSNPAFDASLEASLATASRNHRSSASQSKVWWSDPAFAGSSVASSHIHRASAPRPPVWWLDTAFQAPASTQGTIPRKPVPRRPVPRSDAAQNSSKRISEYERMSNMAFEFADLEMANPKPERPSSSVTTDWLESVASASKAYQEDTLVDESSASSSGRISSRASYYDGTSYSTPASSARSSWSSMGASTYQASNTVRNTAGDPSSNDPAKHVVRFWKLTGELPDDLDKTLHEPHNGQACTCVDVVLVRALVEAEKADLPALQVELGELLRAVTSDRIVNINAARIGMEMSEPNSPLRELMAKQIVRGISWNRMRNGFQDLYNDLSEDAHNRKFLEKATFRRLRNTST